MCHLYLYYLSMKLILTSIVSGKTAESSCVNLLQVRQRFFMLMKLFEVSTKDESERGLGENGSSSEEDEESGTCDSDQEPV